MKNKNMVIAGLAAVIVIIIALIIVLFVKGNDKKKDTKKDDTKKTEVKYEVKDQIYEDITITNIEVEALDDQTNVIFTVKNNLDVEIPEGMREFIIEAGNVPVEEVASYTSAIEPKGSIDISVIINGKYDKIDSIRIKD